MDAWTAAVQELNGECHLSVFVPSSPLVVRLSRLCGQLVSPGWRDMSVYLVVSSRDNERSSRFWVVFPFLVVYCMIVEVVCVC